MMLLNIEQVWVLNEAGVYVLGKQIGTNGTETEVQVGEQRKMYKAAEVYQVNATIQDPLEDMSLLSHLNEPTIVHHLSQRFSASRIYTYTGPILVALNPYTVLPDLYGAATMHKYRNQTLGKQPPHVCSIFTSAHSTLTHSRSTPLPKNRTRE